MTTKSIHTELVEARFAPEVLAVVRRAAEIEGRSLSNFIVGTAREAARRTIADDPIVDTNAAGLRRFAA